MEGIDDIYRCNPCLIEEKKEKEINNVRDIATPIDGDYL
jgi:hypothetical protein